MLYPLFGSYSQYVLFAIWGGCLIGWIMGVIKTAKNKSKGGMIAVLLVGLLLSFFIGWIISLFIKKDDTTEREREREQFNNLKGWRMVQLLTKMLLVD